MMKIRRAASAFAAGLIVVSCWTAEASAQGFGMGFMMPWNTVPSPTNFVNDWALQNAARGGRRPPSNNVYANNPNSYINRLRDPGFVSQYDARGRSSGRRRPAASPRSLGDLTAPPEQVENAPAAPARRPSPLLASFFNAAGRLVWPADAPYDGELKPKRDLSDEAAAAVRQEVDAHGWAPIAQAAEARQKLLDYGRPALQELRENSSPLIAEAFHGFLRSLYDSLSDATIPPPPEPPR